MKTNDPILRALYIILVPVVLLIILLNTGMLQRFLPAVTVDGEKYTVVRYNYYYFDYYNSFLEENEGRLAELGYDPELSDSEQSYDPDTTWKEFFQAEAEANLAETAYYYDLAVEAGYQFSEEELAPVEEKLAHNYEQQILYSINSDNYYISYYGSGMDEARYTEELTRQVKAQAYKKYLASTYEPTQADIDQWLAANPIKDYRSADLRIITLEALPDRATGQVGLDQLAALETKLGKREARYEGGVSFEELQTTFSTCALGDQTGALTAVAGALPEELAAWCLEGQDSRSVGDTLAYADEETGLAYFVIFDGLGENGPAVEAKAALAEAAAEATRQQIMSDYPVERSTIGMLLATA